MRAKQAEQRGKKQNSIRKISPFLSPIWGKVKEATENKNHILYLICSILYNIWYSWLG